MKKEVIKATGICGLSVTFTYADITALCNMKKSLEKLKANHEAVEAYNKMPYDQRKDMERPIHEPMPDSQLNQILNLFKKLSLECAESNIFDDEDEPHTDPDPRETDCE